jgi:hypothetical protein
MMVGVSTSDDAPIVLDALDQPEPGLILAHREGEPEFLWVQDLGDAVQAAWARGVDLVIPATIYEEIRDELPPELPEWIKIV